MRAWVFRREGELPFPSSSFVMPSLRDGSKRKKRLREPEVFLALGRLTVKLISTLKRADVEQYPITSYVTKKTQKHVKCSY